MTMEPTPQLVAERLRLASETLLEAKALLREHLARGAINRAYYAVFYAAVALLLADGANRPRSHKATMMMFHRHYVRTGRIERSYYNNFARIFDLRHLSDYELYTASSIEEVEITVEQAESFVIETTRIWKSMDKS